MYNNTNLCTLFAVLDGKGKIIKLTLGRRNFLNGAVVAAFHQISLVIKFRTVG
jgi:hypothetical protein